MIAGERRWRAAQLAGIGKIPAVVRSVVEEKILELALVENLQRKDLNPIEEAKAYDILLEQMKLSQAEVAKRVGRERSSVANSLRLLKLDEKIKRMLEDGTLTTGHAKAIMALTDGVTQIKVAEEVVRSLLSVRETETLVSRMAKKKAAAPDAAATPAGQMGADDPNARAADLAKKKAAAAAKAKAAALAKKKREGIAEEEAPAEETPVQAAETTPAEDSDDLAKKKAAAPDAAATPAGRIGNDDPNVRAAEDRLRQALGTKVRIVR